jgi:hypothetical protein
MTEKALIHYSLLLFMERRSIIFLVLTLTFLSSVSSFAFVSIESDRVFATLNGGNEGDNNPPTPSCDPVKVPNCPPPCPEGATMLVNGKCQTNPPPACHEGETMQVNGKCQTNPQPCPRGETMLVNGKCQTNPPQVCPGGATKMVNGKCQTNPPPACPEGETMLVNGKCQTNPPQVCPGGATKPVNGKCEQTESRDISQK